MHDTPDAELLAAFRGGDREAFAVLVARHQGVVRAACLRQAPPGEVEDCIQAVFLVLAKRPASATRAPALAAWLLRVAWYVCRRAQRSARRRRQAEGQAAQASGRHTAVRPEALDHLDDCLAKLPERQRVAVSLQYLAGRAPEEVATALGVSRDNAYQLVSRGLAALRGLLARRGVALGTPALLTVLAGESQAATAGSGATASIALSLSATPSAGAVTLATGASTAMTIAALTPVASAAATLLLSAGVATAVVSAESAAATAPAATAPAATAPAATAPAARLPAAARPVQAPTDLDKALEQEITLDFQDTKLTDVIGFVQRVSNQNIVLDPQVAKQALPVTLKVERMRLRHVLGFVEKLTGTTHSVRDGAYHIHAPAPPVAAPAAKPVPRTDFNGADQRLQEKLAQRVTFDFQDTPLDDIVTFFRQVTGANCVLTPAAARKAQTATVTLKVREMRFRDAITWISEISGLTVRAADQALVFDVEPAAGVAPAVPEQAAPAAVSF